jgi:hypothetical protein
MPRSDTSQLAEINDLIQRDIEAGQVQPTVKKHTAVTRGQHKTVAIKPAWFPRVVAQGDTEEHRANFSAAKRKPQMPRLASSNSI